MEWANPLKLAYYHYYYYMCGPHFDTYNGRRVPIKNILTFSPIILCTTIFLSRYREFRMDRSYSNQLVWLYISHMTKWIFDAFHHRSLSNVHFVISILIYKYLFRIGLFHIGHLVALSNVPTYTRIRSYKRKKFPSRIFRGWTPFYLQPK